MLTVQRFQHLCFQQNEPTSDTDIESAGNSSNRIGRLYLLSLGHLPSDKASQQDSAAVTELDLLHSTDVPGVLDIKWCDGIYGHQQIGLPLFAVADANGDLGLWSVNRLETTGAAECHLLEILSAEDGGSMALSLDWSTAVCRRYQLCVLLLFSCSLGGISQAYSL